MGGRDDEAMVELDPDWEARRGSLSEFHVPLRGSHGEMGLLAGRDQVDLHPDDHLSDDQVAQMPDPVSACLYRIFRPDRGSRPNSATHSS